MQAGPFDEEAFFRAVWGSGARAVLIGRRALIALGLPVLTGDYDLWLHVDDVEKLNRALEPMELFPNRAPDAARKLGRYVLEGDERVDVLIARRVSTIDATPVVFDEVWERRQRQVLTDGTEVFLPSLDDLIATKCFAARPKDIEDLRLLRLLKEESS
jgi:hypothetical protein